MSSEPAGPDWDSIADRYAATPKPVSTGPAIGDAAGEHLEMRRGKYDAWIWVGIAFLMQIGLVGSLVGLLPILYFGGDEMLTVGLCVGGVIGLVAAFFTFRDRWRVNEAFSSRFCSGLANLSLIYVPWIALVYANIRGLKKLRGG